MPDPITQYTELTLGDKTYKLCFDFDAIAKAEAITGLSLFLGIDFDRVKVAELLGMLYASALKAQPTVTLLELKPHLRKPKQFRPIVEKLVEAWALSNKDEDENPQQPEPAAAENA